jgi:hypothetical protein
MNVISEILKRKPGSLIEYCDGGIYDQMVEDFKSNKTIPNNWKMKKSLCNYEFNLQRPDKKPIIKIDEEGNKYYFNIVKIFLYIGVDWKDYSLCYTFGSFNKPISQIITLEHKWELDFSEINYNLEYYNCKCKICKCKGKSPAEQMKYIIPDDFFKPCK